MNKKTDDWIKSTSDILNNLKTVQKRLQKLFGDIEKENDGAFAKFSVDTGRRISDMTRAQEKIMDKINNMISLNSIKNQSYFDIIKLENIAVINEKLTGTIRL